LQSDIVVEFDPQNIDVGNRVGHLGRPATGVRQVSQRDRLLAPFRRDLDPKSERRSAVMSQRNRLDPKPVGQQKRVKVELTGQFRFFQFPEWRGLSELQPMTRVAVERNSAGRQPSQSRKLDVVTMRVSQHDRLDAIPIRADGTEPFTKDSRSQADVDQNTDAPRLNQR